MIKEGHFDGHCHSREGGNPDVNALQNSSDLTHCILINWNINSYIDLKDSRLRGNDKGGLFHENYFILYTFYLFIDL